MNQKSDNDFSQQDGEAKPNPTGLPRLTDSNPMNRLDYRGPNLERGTRLLHVEVSPAVTYGCGIPVGLLLGLLVLISLAMLFSGSEAALIVPGTVFLIGGLTAVAFRQTRGLGIGLLLLLGIAGLVLGMCMVSLR